MKKCYVFCSVEVDVPATAAIAGHTHTHIHPHPWSGMLGGRHEAGVSDDDEDDDEKGRNILCGYC